VWSRYYSFVGLGLERSVYYFMHNARMPKKKEILNWAFWTIPEWGQTTAVSDSAFYKIGYFPEGIGSPRINSLGKIANKGVANAIPAKFQYHRN